MTKKRRRPRQHTRRLRAKRFKKKKTIVNKGVKKKVKEGVPTGYYPRAVSEVQEYKFTVKDERHLQNALKEYKKLRIKMDKWWKSKEKEKKTDDLWSLLTEEQQDKYKDMDSELESIGDIIYRFRVKKYPVKAGDKVSFIDEGEGYEGIVKGIKDDNVVIGDLDKRYFVVDTIEVDLDNIIKEMWSEGIRTHYS